MEKKEFQKCSCKEVYCCDECPVNKMSAWMCNSCYKKKNMDFNSVFRKLKNELEEKLQEINKALMINEEIRLLPECEDDYE